MLDRASCAVHLCGIRVQLAQLAPFSIDSITNRHLTLSKWLCDNHSVKSKLMRGQNKRRKLFVWKFSITWQSKWTFWTVYLMNVLNDAVMCSLSSSPCCVPVEYVIWSHNINFNQVQNRCLPCNAHRIFYQGVRVGERRAVTTTERHSCICLA